MSYQSTFKKIVVVVFLNCSSGFFKIVDSEARCSTQMMSDNTKKTPDWIDKKLSSLSCDEFNHAIEALHFAAGTDNMAYVSDDDEDQSYDCVSCNFTGNEDETWSVCACNLLAFTRAHLLIDRGHYATFDSVWCEPEPSDEGTVRTEHCCCALRKCHSCWNADFERILTHFDEVMPQYEEWAYGWILPREYTDENGEKWEAESDDAEFAASPQYVNTFDWDDDGKLELYDLSVIEREKLVNLSRGCHQLDYYWTKKIVNNVFIKIRVSRWVARVRERLYAPGGCAYLRAEKRWNDMVVK